MALTFENFWQEVADGGLPPGIAEYMGMYKT
jgi:hypothetical protein